MPKVAFTITSDATLQTLFVLPFTAPDQGHFVPLEVKDGARTGTADLGSGKHHYLVRLEAGSPQGDWVLVIQREGRQPAKRKGALDASGNGGDIGQITIL